ncbi:AbrB/MazE/SpoVT family DNA-binding domain-containing protein [Terricaulis sp.]|uniref:AbrB/MazE/SpoVT family DNA-binding domain-containing protein n=1 Tax=Terricaulis sp. TaxID=2768686 RepID=UPI002AC46CC9|nr:AbrB/MazE/SpoVT family DNA-binding domain-containing protein [Terricaulis sp.]MDZ4690669.1 AbrB/MazE/SpoVT family DNA-binding domain-containing protein [Terricaulis sp.]
MTDDPKKPVPKGVADSERFDFEAAKPAKPAGRTLKVRKIGNSLGVVLPKDVLAKLKVSEGDELSVSETPDGVALTGTDRDTADLMKLAEDIMAKRRRVLKALAQ